MLVVFVVGAAMASGMPAASATNFGVRELPVLNRLSPTQPVSVYPITDGAEFGVSTLDSRSVNISAIAAIGAAWGRVTSTRRSPEHNRRVGGVRNSFHLSGRAIDIARRSGVSHSAIAAAYRNAGYYLVESLDENDHSHFAFSAAGQPRKKSFPSQVLTGMSAAGTQWKIVSAPR